MSSHPLPKDKSLSKFVSHFPSLDFLCKKIILKKFTELKFGQLTIEDRSAGKNNEEHFGDFAGEIKVRIIVHHSRFYSRTLIGGSIGNAESYVDEDWSTDNLTNLVRLFVLNREVLQKIDAAPVNVLAPIQKYFHGLNKNTIEGSKENIRSHYDMGNDFFKLFLDESMMYSCAFFENQNTTLYEASIKKVSTILSRLNLKSSDHLVEIGSGWGTLAIFAAQNYGCNVTTTTISSEQYNYVVNRVRELGLEDQITVLFEDYRKLKGTFDALVSVEMIEAVGLDNLDIYFEQCSKLVKPNGKIVIQAITIRDQFYESARKSVDFIQRHIFPGSGIPSIHSIMNSIAHKTDLILVEQQDYAEDYAQTLWHWSKRLEANKDEITKLGYPNFLYRLWQYYFSYCEGGFRERAIGVSQLLFAKPLNRDKKLVKKI